MGELTLEKQAVKQKSDTLSGPTIGIYLLFDRGPPFFLWCCNGGFPPSSALTKRRAIWVGACREPEEESWHISLISAL